MSNYKSRIEKNDNESDKILIKKISENITQIEEITSFFLGKEDDRQGIVRNPENSVIKRLNNAKRYVGSRPNTITNTEKLLLKHAYNDLKKGLEKTNNYYNDNWESLKNEIESINFSEFKPIKKISLDN